MSHENVGIIDVPKRLGYNPVMWNAIAALAMAAPLAAEPSLTIYNGGFAVGRQSLDINLKGGLNRLSSTDITRHLEPASVILRDPARKLDFAVLEQNFTGDPLSQDRLLQMNEGKTIGFEAADGKVVQGKVIRAPYSLHQSALRRYGQSYYATQMANAYGAGAQPIVEVNGKLQFALPGKPLFPALNGEAVLKPTLSWLLDARRAGSAAVELSYVTGGMSWDADYNVIGPEKGDRVEVIGWVTMDNQSGKGFENVAVSLMAGDVSKVTPMEMASFRSIVGGAKPRDPQTAVTERPFDEYHLYSLPRPITLADRETKQVEFLRAANVKTRLLYVYDGVYIDPNRYSGWNYENIRQNREYGTASNRKVWTMRELRNEEASGLGAPLPKGRMRFYRQDGPQLHFIGENVIDHTPTGETLRVYTGDAFDLVGERRQTQYNIKSSESVDEAFEIRVRNRKKEAVEVRIVERLYRGMNWEITQKSDPFEKRDSQNVEFVVAVPAGGEKVVTYSVHYTW